MRRSLVRISRSMQRDALSRLLLAPLLLSVTAVPAAGVRHLNLSVDRIEFGGLIAQGVQADLDLDARGGAGLVLMAAAVQLPPALSLENVRIDCSKGALDARELRCEHGSLTAHVAGQGDISAQASLQYRFDGSAGAFTLQSQLPAAGSMSARASVQEGNWEAELHARTVPLAAVQGFTRLAGIQPGEYSDVTGSIDADVSVNGGPGTPVHAEGGLKLHGAGFLGANSAENLDMQTEFRVQQEDAWEVFVNGSLTGGLLYLEPGLEMNGFRPGVALEAPASPISFLVDAGWSPDTRHLQLRMLDVSHPGVGALRLRTDLQWTDALDIRSVDATLTGADAGRLYTTYLQPFLIGAQFDSLEAAGLIDAGISIRNNELRSLTVGLHDVHAYDGNNRFSIAGLDGDLRIYGGSTPVHSTLRWAGISIYKLQFGGGEIDLESSNADASVTRWVDVPLLDGTVKIDSLNVTKAGRKDMRIELDGSITPVSMANLTQQIDWPIMSGTLAGRIAGLSYQHGRLTVDGDININVFDGNLIVSGLSVDDLFGLVPVMHADVRVDGIDLKLLSDRFSFGSIEGRLDGYVHALELQAWQPVYFDARLETPADDPTPHRISQRAVDNLGYLGGGSTSALSSGFLKFLPSYSYGRLGLGCRLYNGACEMSGVAPTPDGFLILTRGGALPPWIEVKGTGKSIEWSALIEGLKSIASNPAQIR